MSRVSTTISIILPTYNRADRILETIQSVRQQSQQDWELLVIDDYSTDNTSNLVKQIADPRIKLFRTERRVGITTSRQIGVQEANADLIAFIDSDDLWDEKKLEEQFSAFRQYPEAGFCMTSGYTFKEPGKPIVFYHQKKTGVAFGDLLIPLYKSEIAALTPSLMFRKNCLEKIEFSTHVEFILELAANFKGIMMYAPFLQRRLHESNTSDMEWENRLNEGIRILKKYAVFVPKQISKEVLFKTHINAGEKYLSRKKNWKAFGHFFHAWAKKPVNVIPIKKIGKAIFHTLFK